MNLKLFITKTPQKLYTDNRIIKRDTQLDYRIQYKNRKDADRNMLKTTTTSHVLTILKSHEDSGSTPALAVPYYTYKNYAIQKSQKLH